MKKLLLALLLSVPAYGQLARSDVGLPSAILSPRAIAPLPDFGSPLAMPSSQLPLLGVSSAAMAATPPGGSDTNIQYNNAGAFGGFGAYSSTYLVLPSNKTSVGTGTTATPTYGFQFTPTSGLTAGLTAIFQDLTATTGATKFVVKSGAGQSGVNLMEWQSASAVVGVSIGEDLSINGYAGGVLKAKLSNYLYLASDAAITWSSANNATTPIDTGIARNAAGILEVNNGTPGTIATIRAQYKSSDGTAGLSATCTLLSITNLVFKNGIAVSCS